MTDLTRRTLLAATAAGATLPFTMPAARAATPAGIMVMVRQMDDVVSFDPAESYEFANGELVTNAYRRLVAPDLQDNTKVVGDLAESWTVSPDGTTFTFKLHNDAVFASGNKLTAGDAAFSLQRVAKLNKTPAFILTQFGFNKDNVDGLIMAPDESTLVVKVPSAAAPSFVLVCLSANVGSIVDRATVMQHAQGEDLGNGWLKTNTAGAGVYQLTSWVASDHINAAVNPHTAADPALKRIVIRHVADPSAQLLLLTKGDADVARDLKPDQLRTLAGNKDVTLVSASAGTSMYLAMNQTVPELQHKQVQQAIKWAIDYHAIADNITPNQWIVGQSFLPKVIPGALTDEPFRRDPAKARALLAEAGLANGFAVTMDMISASPYSDIAQAIQANLADVGIKVTLLPGEQKQVITKMRARQHQLSLLYWGTDYFDANSNAQAFCENPDDSDASKLKILAWRSHFKDDELTALSQSAAKEVDTAKRLAIYADLQRKFWDRAPFAMLLQNISTAVEGHGVSGFVVRPVPDRLQYAKVRKA